MTLAGRLFAAPWLGHGRAIESYLIGVSGLYGVILLSPGAAFDSSATADIAWSGYGHLLAAPLIAYSLIAGLGLVGNIRGWQRSRQLRVAGSFGGFLIWSWLGYKFALTGNFAAVGFPFSFFAALYSIRVIVMASASLPRPGAPGAM